MEKTFAQKVKTELCQPRVERKCCAVAEAYGVLLYAHSFSAKEIRITTASDELAARLPHLMRRAFGIDFDEPIILGYSGLSDSYLKKYVEDSRDIWQDKADSLDSTLICSVIGTHTAPGVVAVAFFKKG